ncbi:hypothetical protein DO97_01040 [Neosynechococcus sphagnicola sy1]|uniref:HD/PDEase domain-containing protein n=1 Tax=Neosynechococcus sphagnicola sy1 TaxID=1497020 RepID=A0A098TLR0_9CYAN|nr:HDIG domain-containing metalloprotein [Neosynechococcus sphagnicola]KGF73245.1 hypothetical protein DO97_01040 [Neosynechococcus sphagnicola sy1]
MKPSWLWSRQLSQLYSQCCAVTHQRWGSIFPIQPSQSTNAAENQPECHETVPIHPWLRLSCSSWKDPRSSTVLVVAVLSLSGVVGNRFYNDPKLDVGTIAPETIKAPASAQVEDVQATEEKRHLARSDSGTVFILDPAVNQQIHQDLQQLLQQLQALRQLPGSVPFVPPTTLSIASQSYLRQAPELEWQQVRNAVAASPQVASQRLEQPHASAPTQPAQAIAELLTYGQNYSPAAIAELLVKVEGARQQYAQLQSTLANTALADHHLDADLLNLSEADWQHTRMGVQQATRRMVAQGIFPSLAPGVLVAAVQLQVSESIPRQANSLATQIVMTVLRSNVVPEPNLTQLRAEQAAQAVPPVIISIHQGEVIVPAGGKISATNFVLLDHFQLSRRGINWMGLLGCSLLVSGSIAVFWLMEKRFHRRLRRRDYTLVLLLSLSAPLLATFGISSTSLPMVGLLVGSFYGSILGATVVLLLTGMMAVGISMPLSFLISSAVGGLVGGALAGRMRSREELALLGGAVGIMQGVVYLLLYLTLNTGGPLVWYVVVSTTLIQGLAGFAWSVMTLGLSPYLEHVFDVVTPIRLAELSNPNRPLLKRLATEAPGTFQHTLFVATLAEAAAQVLKCNVELVRAGTLYHDIGKMHDPLGFIENQMSGPNKHDAIADPWQSTLLIKKHVSEGLVMARKCRLPRAIQAFIPEHQGTMLIAYFYHQAQEQAKQDPSLHVEAADFRYPGPIPQSRESGIVMLADSCEAALRSLKDATPEAALYMVNKILRARWQDNQLIDSGLKREEMPLIAEVFVQVWQQFHHQRIAYPKLSLSGSSRD